MTQTQSIFGRLSTAILRYPTGRYGIVGSIPGELTDNGKSKVWDAEQDVIDALLAIGVTRFQREDCSWYERAQTLDPRAVDVARLSDAEAFAYFKRAAPVDDVTFQLRLDLPQHIREGYEALLATLEKQKGKATAATKTEYRRLQQRWREAVTTYTGKRASESGWNIYYRSDKGEMFAKSGGKLMPVAGLTQPSIVRALPTERTTRRAKPAPVEAVEHSQPAGGDQACVKCTVVQPLSAYTWGDGGRTVRHLCLTCRKAQQRDAAARRKQAA